MYLYKYILPWSSRLYTFAIPYRVCRNYYNFFIQPQLTSTAICFNYVKMSGAEVKKKAEI